MDDHPVADQRMLDGGVRADEAVAADGDRLGDDRARCNDGAAADLGARADQCARLHHHALFQLRKRMHGSLDHVAAGLAISAGRPERRRIGRCEIGSVGAVRLRRLQHRNVLRDARGIARVAQAGRRPRVGQVLHVFRVVEEGEIAFARRLQGRRAMDRHGRVAARQLGSDELGDLVEAQRCGRRKEPFVMHRETEARPAPKRQPSQHVRSACRRRSGRTASRRSPRRSGHRRSRHGSGRAAMPRGWTRRPTSVSQRVVADTDAGGSRSRATSRVEERARIGEERALEADLARQQRQRELHFRRSGHVDRCRPARRPVSRSRGPKPELSKPRTVSPPLKKASSSRTSSPMPTIWPPCTLTKPTSSWSVRSSR